MKKFSALAGVLLLSSSLFAACSPTATPNRTDGNRPGVQNIGGRTDLTNPNRYNTTGVRDYANAGTLRADRNLAARVESIPGIRSASVLVIGNTAYVGINQGTAAPNAARTPAANAGNATSYGGTTGGTVGGTTGGNLTQPNNMGGNVRGNINSAGRPGTLRPSAVGVGPYNTTGLPGVVTPGVNPDGSAIGARRDITPGAMQNAGTYHATDAGTVRGNGPAIAPRITQRAPGTAYPNTVDGRTGTTNISGIGGATPGGTTGVGTGTTGITRYGGVNAAGRTTGNVNGANTLWGGAGVAGSAGTTGYGAGTAGVAGTGMPAPAGTGTVGTTGGGYGMGGAGANTGVGANNTGRVGTTGTGGAAGAGITQDNTVPADLKTRVANTIRQANPAIQNVYVTANPAVVGRMDAFVRDTVAGHPIRGINDLLDTLRRMFPAAR